MLSQHLFSTLVILSFNSSTRSLQRNRLIVRKPDVNILADFTITFE